MSINFDHSRSGNVTLQTEDQEGFSCFVFPRIENGPLEIMVSNHANTSYISGFNTSGSGFCDSFNYTNNINTNCSFTYSLTSGSTTETFDSLILGGAGKSKYNYEDGYNYQTRIDQQVVHSAGYLYNLGDSQFTTLLSRAYVDTTQCVKLLCATLDLNTAVYIDLDAIGMCSAFACKYAAFNIKGTLYKNNDNTICSGLFRCSYLLQPNVLSPYDTFVSLDDGNFSIAVSGEGSAPLQWLTRVKILEIPSTTGVGGPSTFGIYWTNTNDINWFNLYNWYSNAYQTNAIEYPRITTNVIMSGDYAAYTNIDCELWIEPNSIDTTRIAEYKGICLYSDAGRAFSKNIYGNAILYGNAVFGDSTEAIYWTNTVDTNWFNLSNWYLNNSFTGNASRLPLCIANVFTYGNSGVYINLDCNLWIQPHSINATNSSSAIKVCIYSQNSCSFSGIVYGSVNLYGNATFI